MKRHFMQKLLQWRHQKNRKPLIISGARQVGKTYLLRQLGQDHFPQAHYINFEKSADLADLFEAELDPRRIIDALSFHLGTAINVEQDLMIWDEIQACPRALTSLKYFQEEMPELALCSAGSLLGVYLAPVSFPVGKIHWLTLHPMSFEEFLLAIDDEKSVSYLAQCNQHTKTPAVIHHHLWERLKWYFVVGGLPEAVNIFHAHYHHLYLAMEKVREQQMELIKTYHADMAKHAGKVNAMHIDRVWKSIPQQLARSQDGSAAKFKCKGVVPGIDRYHRLASAIDWLQATGLIIKVPLVKVGRLPFSAYSQENLFKLFLFDIGILGALSELSPKVILDYDYGTYKGYFAENYVAQAFREASVDTLYSWQENRAEVEFLRTDNGHVLPIEVKSGWVKHAKSLQTFAEKYQVPYRTIMSAESLFIDVPNRVHHYPLYLASRFPLQDNTTQ